METIKNTRLWRMLLLILILAASGVPFKTAQAQGILDATLSTDSQNITVGDVIPLTLRVTHPGGWRVIFPTLEEQWGDFEVRSQAAPEIVTNPDGSQTTTQEIKVVHMRPGDVLTPALTLSVANDQGSLSSVEVAPLAVSVGSVLIEGDSTLREIKPQAELVSEGRPYWPLMAAGVLGAAALSLYGIRRWRRRRLIDRRTPRQRTLDSLTALSALNPQTPAGMAEQCALLADCLRDYLAAVTRLPARDLTTRELTRRFKDQDIPTAWSAQVVDVLRVCDGVKFANEELERATIQAMISTVRNLVEDYPPQPQPARRRQGRKKQAEVIA